MTRFPYTYTVLRYVHDIATEEFVNVGVVLVSPEGRFADFRLRSTTGRLSCMFSDFDGEHFRRVIRHLEDRLATLAKQVVGLPFKEHARDALAMATRVIREDDSAFQWSPPGGGVSSDLRHTLDRIYERLVARHDDSPRESRSGEDIWMTFSKRMGEAVCFTPFPPGNVSATDNEIEFQHAPKNPERHWLEPSPFDLRESQRIQELLEEALRSDLGDIQFHTAGSSLMKSDPVAGAMGQAIRLSFPLSRTGQPLQRQLYRSVGNEADDLPKYVRLGRLVQPSV